MPSCENCGTFILFGGQRGPDGERFCTKNCLEAGLVKSIGRALPEEDIDTLADQVHKGACPQCGGPGPNDMHTAHKIHSFVVMTAWNSKSKICCRRCGKKFQWGAVAHSALLGWWGFPWGIIMTPVMLARNFTAMGRSPDAETPSRELKVAVRAGAAHQIAYER